MDDSTVELSVNIGAVGKAFPTLEFFAKFYLPLHGLRPSSLFDFPDYVVVQFVEAALYQIDELNELVPPGGVAAWGGERDFRLTLQLLEDRGVLSPTIAAEMGHLQEYWLAERDLIESGFGAYPEAEFLRLFHHKSADLRIMHELLCVQSDIEMEPSLMEFCRYFEHAMELYDDFLDYPSDVVRGSFNIVCYFEHHHGSKRGAARLMDWAREAIVEPLTALEAKLGPARKNEFRRCVLARYGKPSIATLLHGAYEHHLKYGGAVVASKRAVQ